MTSSSTWKRMKKVLGLGNSQNKHKSKRQRHLRLESLEVRHMLSVSPWGDAGDGPLGFYSFENNLNADIHSYHGTGCGDAATAEANMPWMEANVVNHVLELDGQGDYVSLGNPAAMNFEGEITLAAWVKSEVTYGTRTIVSHGYDSDSPANGVYLQINNGYYEIGSWDGAFHRARFAIPSSDTDNWVHLCGVYDGTSWRLYRNGAEVASCVDGTGAVEVDADWTIGGHPVFGQYFRGQIDDVYIFDRALSPQEVTDFLESSLTPSPPSASADTYVLTSGEAVVLDVLANDGLSGNGELSLAGPMTWTSTSGAGISRLPGNQLHYNPAVIFAEMERGTTQTDTFEYTVINEHGLMTNGIVMVALTKPANQAPTAVDDSATTDIATAISVVVLANDFDSDDDIITLSSFSEVSSLGVPLTRTWDGKIVYDPSHLDTWQELITGVEVVDSFTYTIADSYNAVSTATIYITVTRESEAEVVEIADTWAYALDENAKLALAFSTSLKHHLDSQVMDSAWFALHTPPMHGNAEVFFNGAMNYAPEKGFSGVDTFVVEVTFAGGDVEYYEILLAVNAINHAPVAVNDYHATDYVTSIAINPLVNDTDPDAEDLLALSGFDATSLYGVPLTLDSSGRILYDPSLIQVWDNIPVGFFSTDSFSYSITDAGGSVSTATVFIDVTRSNRAPVATSDTLTITSGEPVTINVLENDYDLDPFDFISLASEGKWTSNLGATVNPITHHSVLYDPSAIYDTMLPGTTCIDTFTYTIKDITGATSTSSVTVTIEKPIHAGYITPQTDWATVAAGQVISIPIQLNDNVPEHLDVSVEILSVSGGTAMVDNQGTSDDFTDDTIRFTAGTTHGAYQITYRLVCGEYLSQPATVHVGVIADPSVPILLCNEFSLYAKDSLTLSLPNMLSQSVIPQGATVTFGQVSTCSNGTFQWDATTQSITYTPSYYFIGDATCSYTITCDQVSYTGTIMFHVLPRPIIPQQNIPDITPGTAAGFQLLSQGTWIDPNYPNVVNYHYTPGKPVERSFVISNLGHSTLSLVLTSTSLSSQFEITQYPDAVVKPGMSTIMKVLFYGEEDSAASFTFSTNDTQNRTVIINYTETAEPPQTTVYDLHVGGFRSVRNNLDTGTLPVIEGCLGKDLSSATSVLQFDLNGNSSTIEEEITMTAGRNDFSLDISDYYSPGANKITIRYRIATTDDNWTTYSSWKSYEFYLDADPLAGAIRIENTRMTSINANGEERIDPYVIGQVNGDFDSQPVQIQFSHTANAVLPLATLNIPETMSTFYYDPWLYDSDFVAPTNGSGKVYYRLVIDGVPENWQIFNLTYPGVSGSMSVSYAETKLATKNSIDYVSNPTRKISFSTNYADNNRIAVRWDTDNDGIFDQVTEHWKDLDGYYCPEGLPKDTALQLRAQCYYWNATLELWVPGASWTSGTYVVTDAYLNGISTYYTDENAPVKYYISASVSANTAMERAYVRIAIDLNEDGIADAYTYTDSTGKFSYYPDDSTLGYRTIRATVCADDVTANGTYAWTSVSYQHALKDVSHRVDTIKLSADSLFITPYFEGKMTEKDSYEGCVVEFSHVGNQIADGRVPVNEDGTFTYLAVGAANSGRMYYRVGKWNPITGDYIYTSWSNSSYNFSNRSRPLFF